MVQGAGGVTKLMLINDSLHSIMECEGPESGKQEVYHQKFNSRMES